MSFRHPCRFHQSKERTIVVYNTVPPASVLFFQQGQDRDPRAWIQTYTGRQFWPLDPRPEDVDILDIAHHLSNACRFAGAVHKFYSVAQHSVLVSEIVPKEMALVGLLHDAPEAYMGDLVKPIKSHRDFYEYVRYEKQLWYAVTAQFGLPEHIPDEVHEADGRALVTERRDLLPPRPPGWEQTARGDWDPLDLSIIPLQPERAEECFLRRYEEITGEKIQRTVALPCPPKSV